MQGKQICQKRVYLSQGIQPDVRNGNSPNIWIDCAEGIISRLRSLSVCESVKKRRLRDIEMGSLSRRVAFQLMHAIAGPSIALDSSPFRRLACQRFRTTSNAHQGSSQDLRAPAAQTTTGICSRWMLQIIVDDDMHLSSLIVPAYDTKKTLCAPCECLSRSTRSDRFVSSPGADTVHIVQEIQQASVLWPGSPLNRFALLFRQERCPCACLQVTRRWVQVVQNAR